MKGEKVEWASKGYEERDGRKEGEKKVGRRRLVLVSNDSSDERKKDRKALEGGWTIYVCKRLRRAGGLFGEWARQSSQQTGQTTLQFSMFTGDQTLHINNVI